ncbi:OmpA family protein [Neisseria montereyensis]|uniref:OmpA family protein n=1 Tax=Neisseria montereyensis TaxID=2973938 RepID=A0ABT2FC48_9NEIS|nr:OmpA family protein [Neisseria montereyensis]MCS4533130.1 OmpA family protein [Neisseria montereyensis]
MFQYRKLLWMLLPLTAMGCVSHPKESWVDTQQAAYSTAVPENRSSVVIYRQAGAVEGPTVNIYVNGQYSGSLQPNAYRQETVCAQNQRFYAEFTKQDIGYRNKHQLGDYYNLPESAVSFFKVVDDGNGNPVLRAVSPEQAEQEMQGIPRQNHTLSRVVSSEKCAVVLKKYSLQASALFKFDRSDYASVLPKGKQELTNISNEIKQNPDLIRGIAVVGHADPAGSPEYNQKLSYDRAVTVKKVLEDTGLDKRLISAEGRGERELVVNNCRVQHPNNSKARIACDQPNRRVDVILHGEKQ